MMKFNPEIHHRRSIRLKGYDYSREGLYFITICCHDRICVFGNIPGNDSVGAQKFVPGNTPGNDSVGAQKFVPGNTPDNDSVGAQKFVPGNTPDNDSVGVQNVGVQNFEPLHSKQMILNDAGKMAKECWLQIPNHFPNAVLHAYVIMPNHIHGIIELITNTPGNDSVGAQKFVPGNIPGNDSIGVQNAGFKILNPYDPRQKTNSKKLFHGQSGQLSGVIKLASPNGFTNIPKFTVFGNIIIMNTSSGTINRIGSFPNILSTIPQNGMRIDFFTHEKKRRKREGQQCDTGSGSKF